MGSQIVILAPNWLGDAVMALPAIADIRRGTPEARLVVAARSPIRPLFSLVSGIDDAIDVEELATSAFDTAILLPKSFHSALVARRAPIPERWGYRTDWRGPLLTRAVAPPHGVHQIDYYQHLTTALGFAPGSSRPVIAVPPSARESAAALLRVAGWDGRAPLAALAPGAAYGGAKRWPPEYFAELADGLAADRVTSVMVGSGADAVEAAQVRAAVRAKAALLDVVGRTDLTTLAGVLASVRTLVTNDSGAMHVAAAVGVPVTAVFGPTRERETAPRASGSDPLAPAHTILTHDVWCRPCMLRECPLDHSCMRGVPPAAALAAARRALS